MLKGQLHYFQICYAVLDSLDSQATVFQYTPHGTAFCTTSQESSQVVLCMQQHSALQARNKGLQIPMSGPSLL